MMKTHSWKLAGGMNLVRDALSRHKAPGEMSGCMNYEAREEGYRRIDGYERFDGRKSPSDVFADEAGKEDVEDREAPRLDNAGARGYAAGGVALRGSLLRILQDRRPAHDAQIVADWLAGDRAWLACDVHCGDWCRSKIRRSHR